MDEKIESNRSSNILLILYRNNSIFIKFVGSSIVYEYQNFEYEKFKMMKNKSDNDLNYSLGSDVYKNVIVPYGDNFKKHPISYFDEI